MIKPENLLIIRTDRIGDVVLSLPLAGIIKKHFPQSCVTFMVRKYTAALTMGNSNIERTIEAAESNGKILLLENIKTLRKYKFDSCIVVSPTFKIALVIFLSGIKNRIGTGFRWYSFLFNFKKFEHRKYAERHELEYNINLLEFLGINETAVPGKIDYGLKPSVKDREEIEKKFLEWGIESSKPVILLHPGSGGSAVDLPVNKWKDLVNIISKELSVNLIVTGNEKEIALCNEISGANPVTNAAGQLKLNGLIALIDKSALLIANSTGPIHIGAALDKVVIGFYPKIKACSPERWGPYTNKRIIFTPSIDCNNCTRQQCLKWNCMDTIAVYDVLEKIKIILKDKNSGEFNA